MNLINKIKQIIDNISEPFNPIIFFTVRGCENVHIYFWILKDLGWCMNIPWLGITGGLFAIIWLGILLKHAIFHSNNEEIYFIGSTFLWLFANYIWMIGNLLYDSDIFKFPAACIMMSSIWIIIIYAFFLKNKKFFTPHKISQFYNDNGLICEFKFIDTWRRYEHFHTFFWLLKDYCWNVQDKLLWIGAAFITLIVSIHFIIVSCQNPKMTIDTIHYIAQFLWVCSNLTWAMIELFSLGSDNPQSFSELAKSNGRLIAGLLLLFAFVPIFLLYVIWLPLTYFKYKPIQNQSNEPNQFDVSNQNQFNEPNQCVKSKSI